MEQPTVRSFTDEVNAIRDDLIGLIETQHPQEKRDQQNFCENIYNCEKSPKKEKREEYALMNEWIESRLKRRKERSNERVWI